MSLSNRTVWDQYIVPATMEYFAEQVRLFNEASRNTIVLDSANFRGDFIQQAFFDSVRSAQRRTDMHATNAAVAPTDITDHVQTSVKVAGGFGPIRYEPAQHLWMLEPTARSIEVASRNFADALLYDQVNTSVGVAVAAIQSQGTAATNGTALAELTYDTINMAHAKFGASSGLILADIMTGMQYHKFVSKNLTNAPSLLFKAENVTVVDILGKAVVVVDAPGLTAADGTNRVLGLTRGAVVASDSGDIITTFRLTMVSLVSKLPSKQTTTLRLKLRATLGIPQLVANRRWMLNYIHLLTGQRSLKALNQLQVF